MAHLIASLKIVITASIFSLACAAMAYGAEPAKQPDFIQQGVVLQNKCCDGAKIIDKMVDATSKLNNYSSDYQMVVYKKGEPPINETGTIYFRQPRLLRIEVKEGPKKGAVALLGADGKIHGHLGGLLKYFHSTISADSDLARAVNNFPMAGTDFYSLCQYLKNMLKEGDNSLVTESPILTNKTNVATYILDLFSIKKNSKDQQFLLLKRIYVNPETYLPVFWEDYIDGKLWSESSWRNLRINLALPDDLFKL